MTAFRRGKNYVAKGLCECGCGEATPLAPQTHREKGWVKGEPLRYVRGHNNRLSPVEFIEEPERHCWEWQRSRTSLGYGQVGVDGKTRMAYRVYYQALVGPIPDGLELDHLCRNPCCVNPGHLEPVTHRENILRGAGHIPALARQTHCKRGHPFDEANTYRPKTGGRVCRACHREQERDRQRRVRAAA